MADRSRTHSWPPLEESRAAFNAAVPLDYYRGLRGKALPDPVASTIGWSVINVEEGAVRLGLPLGEHLFHSGGILHGGVLALLLDSATAVAALTTLGVGERIHTLAVNVQYLNAVKPHLESLQIVGRVIHRGRRTISSEGQVLDGGGKTYAKATATLLITQVES